MEILKTKTIMTKSNQGNRWFGIDYHMNLYKGCPFGCIYCDSRCEAYHIENFDEVRIKENALEILEEELKSKGLKGVVSFGTLSDPYNPEEKELELTRNALKLIAKYKFGVSIDTKSDLILRDIDLLQEISEYNNVIIKISITTYDDELARKLEPNVITSTKRFQVLKILRQNNLYAGVLMTPVLPFLTDTEENITNMILKSKESDAKFIYTKMGMTLKTNQRDYYYKALDVLYPGLKEDYIAVYGSKHICNSLHYRHLMELYLKMCSENNILTDMDAIIEDYKKEIPQNEQMSLF
ncbi:TPA: radical SAM protein [Candidatus Ventrenecus avicola]|nr:radical SAM protein [Candidatus Ventrenecus avicola]